MLGKETGKYFIILTPPLKTVSKTTTSFLTEDAYRGAVCLLYPLPE